MKPLGIMSKQELKSTLLRSIILEYQNAKTCSSMSWGLDAPPSMFAARRNRIRLARYYSQKYEPVSNLLFQRALPTCHAWQGTGVLISNSIHAWVDGVWSHIGFTVPIEHCRGK